VCYLFVLLIDREIIKKVIETTLLWDRYDIYLKIPYKETAIKMENMRYHRLLTYVHISLEIFLQLPRCHPIDIVWQIMDKESDTVAKEYKSCS